MWRERMTQQILAGAGACALLALLGSVPAASQSDKGSVGLVQMQPPSAKAKRAGELHQFRMQQNMDRQQKELTIRSNVAKKKDQTKKGVVRNMQ